MNLKPNHSEYQQLFSTNGMSYITSDIFMDHYKSLEGMTTFAHDKWTSFIPKRIVEITLRDGLERFRNGVAFKKFKDDFDAYYKESDAFFDTLFKTEEISQDMCARALKYLADNFVHYSKTEFFYVDEAYKAAANNSLIQKHLKEFEDIKNGGREKMNDRFFKPGSVRKRLLQKLSDTFGVPFDDLMSYGMTDLVNLYSGKKLDVQTVDDRRKSYLMKGAQGSITYVQGEGSEKIIDDFFAQDSNSDANQLKGIIANKGKVKGQATVIKYGDNIFSRLPEIISKMPAGNILVADTTAPELIMACKKASAILTNQGGMMSHAAIVSRELKIPCIVGLKNATEKIKDGDMIEVDADKGVVKLI